MAPQMFVKRNTETNAPVCLPEKYHFPLTNSCADLKNSLDKLFSLGYAVENITKCAHIKHAPLYRKEKKKTNPSLGASQLKVPGTREISFRSLNRNAVQLNRAHYCNGSVSINSSLILHLRLTGSLFQSKYILQHIVNTNAHMSAVGVLIELIFCNSTTVFQERTTRATLSKQVLN